MTQKINPALDISEAFNQIDNLLWDEGEGGLDEVIKKSDWLNCIDGEWQIYSKITLTDEIQELLRDVRLCVVIKLFA